LYIISLISIFFNLQIYFILQLKKKSRKTTNTNKITINKKSRKSKKYKNRTKKIKKKIKQKKKKNRKKNNRNKYKNRYKNSSNSSNNNNRQKIFIKVTQIICIYIC